MLRLAVIACALSGTALLIWAVGDSSGVASRARSTRTTTDSDGASDRRLPKELSTEQLRHVRLWLQLSSDAFDRGDFDLAAAQAQQALDIDANNRDATELIRISREARSTSAPLDRRAKFNAEWRRIMAELERGCDLGSPILHYPENWDEIAEK